MDNQEIFIRKNIAYQLWMEQKLVESESQVIRQEEQQRKEKEELEKLLKEYNKN